MSPAACTECDGTHEVWELHEYLIGCPGPTNAHYEDARMEATACPDCATQCSRCSTEAWRIMENGFRQLTNHEQTLFFCDADCLEKWVDAGGVPNAMEALRLTLSVQDTHDEGCRCFNGHTIECGGQTEMLTDYTASLLVQITLDERLLHSTHNKRRPPANRGRPAGGRVGGTRPEAVQE